ncbi:MAG: hypothetical protein KKB76_01815 [Candidatus Omnitrophica bacterium]|nr:hypothetical protein [Candidatus Omnitrophota bacterium]
MEERGLRSNYFFALIKFALFLIIFCFLIELSKDFFKEIKSTQDLKVDVFFLSLLSCLAFYIFIADLNNFYKKIQKFFFRSSFFAFLFSSLLIFFVIGFFLLPKVLNFSFDRDIFLFLGGFILTSHLVFIARETKGSNFIAFIDYLFLFSILYVVNLILFGLYLKVAFRIDLGKVIIDGVKDGVFLMQNIFSQIFK